MSTELAAVARRAAEIIQERGKCVGTLQDNAGRVCLWGALSAAVNERAVISGAFVYLGQFTLPLREMFPDESMVIPGAQFSDRPETTELDVAKVLLQLADRLEVAP